MHMHDNMTGTFSLALEILSFNLIDMEAYVAIKDFIPSLMESQQGSVFLLGWILPFIVLFFVGRSAFCRFLGTIRLRKIFKSMEEKHEAEFAKSLYYCLCVVMSVSIGEYSTRGEAWRSDVNLCFIGWPDHVHPWSLKFYYTFALSFYAYLFFLVAFVEEPKKDHLAMCLHHVVTCTTIFLSGQYDLARIGAVILLLFDVCDIFLEIAKLFTKTKEDIPAIFAFVIFVALWFYNRLWIFPRFVIPAIWNADSLARENVPYLNVHVGIMITLFILQVYWSYFILKKLVGFLKNGLSKKEMEDPREQKC